MLSRCRPATRHGSGSVSTLAWMNPLVQEPAREFQTPIPARYEAAVFVDRMDPPGAIGADFPGCRS